MNVGFETKYDSITDGERADAVYNNLLWDTLLAHRGHHVEITTYSNRKGDIFSVALEDMDTNEVILDAELYTLVAREDV